MTAPKNDTPATLDLDTPAGRLRTIIDDVTAPRDMRNDLRDVLDELDQARARIADATARLDEVPNYPDEVALATAIALARNALQGPR